MQQNNKFREAILSDLYTTKHNNTSLYFIRKYKNNRAILFPQKWYLYCYEYINESGVNFAKQFRGTVSIHKIIYTFKLRDSFDNIVTGYFRKMEEDLLINSQIITNGKKNNQLPLFNQANLKWEDVTITFMSKDSIKINVHDDITKLTFAELGFKDKRKGDLPNQLWELLYQFAKNKGEISWKSDLTDKQRDNLIVTVNRLQKHLKYVVGLSNNPIHRYDKKSKCYKVKFKIADESYGK